MEWYWIVTIIAAAAVAAFVVCFLCLKRKKKQQQPSHSPVREEHVRIEQVAADEIDENALCEIEDPDVADRVKVLMPEAVRAQISAGLVVTNCSKTVYKVILPASTKLAAATGGAASLSAGASMAAAQIGTLAVSSFSAVMSAASMVVGQYYMTLVNQQLKKISERISRLGEFQDSEFKSKVFALHAQVLRSAAFRAETMENTAMREAEIGKLDHLEHECIQLLGQASLMVADYAGRTDLDDQRYLRATAEVDKWFSGQKLLLVLLREIAELRFTLYLGAASREQCGALFRIYAEKAEETRQMLLKWHTETEERLGMQPGESRYRRRGLDRAVHWLPALFKKDLKYRQIPPSTVALIEHQTEAQPFAAAEQDDLFREDVEIIAKDGKFYYLPKPSETKHEDGPQQKEEEEENSHPEDEDLALKVEN